MLDKLGHLKLIDFGTAEITQSTILKPQFKEQIIKLKQKQQEAQPEEPSEEYMAEIGEMDSPLKKRRSTFVGTCQYSVIDLVTLLLSYLNKIIVQLLPIFGRLAASFTSFIIWKLHSKIVMSSLCLRRLKKQSIHFQK